MKTRYLLIAITFVLNLSLLSRPSLGAEKTIMLGAEDSWPPYSDSTGKGISTNIVRAAFAKAGIQVELKITPYARVLQEVKSGVLVGGYNVVRQFDTENCFIFGKQPIFKAKGYWYYAPQRVHKFSSIQQIPEGFRVGGIINYQYGDEYEASRYKFHEIRVSKQTQLIRMLQTGRVDAVVMYEEEANKVLQDMKLPPSAIHQGFYTHTSDIYVAFSKTNAESLSLANTLDKGLTQLKVSGEYEELLRNKNP